MRFSYVVALLCVTTTAAAISLALFWPQWRPVARASGPLPNSVYVWQRQASTPLRNALREHAGVFDHVNRLAAEVTWTPNGPLVSRAELPAEELRHLPSLGLTLRLTALPGQTIGQTGDVRIPFLQKLADALLTQARQNGLHVTEFQIDFDAAESQLHGYAAWLRALRAMLPADVQLTFTALPAWLDQRSGFTALLDSADSYVLQIHSLERPRTRDLSFQLYGIDAARRAVERAARYRKPFLVSLPTYGYRLLFDQNTDQSRIAPAGLPAELPAGQSIRTVQTSPADMLALLDGWTSDRPAALTGVIWFRLPVSDDDLNWSWPTLAAVMDHQLPVAKLQLNIDRSRAPLIELHLSNSGTDTFAGPVSIHFKNNADLLAADALRPFHATADGNYAAPFLRLRPNQEITIAWLRFDPLSPDFHASLETP